MTNESIPLKHVLGWRGAGGGSLVAPHYSLGSASGDVMLRVDLEDFQYQALVLVKKGLRLMSLFGGKELNFLSSHWRPLWLNKQFI